MGQNPTEPVLGGFGFCPDLGQNPNTLGFWVLSEALDAILLKLGKICEACHAGIECVRETGDRGPD